jgi:hypothetical protein
MSTANRPQPHRMPPNTRTEEQRPADRAEVARTWPPPTPDQVRGLRELFRSAVRSLVEEELREHGIEPRPSSPRTAR